MKELDIAKEVALKAGDLIMFYYKRDDLKIEDKGGYKENYLTEADKAVEKLIFKELTNEFPNYGFIGEETYNHKVIDKEFIWIVDPIDGTKGFVNQTDQFGVQIGLIKNNEPILGVIYLPVFKKLYWAVKDQGSYLNNKKIQVSKTNNLKKMNMWISPRASYDKELNSYIEKIPAKKKFSVDSVATKATAIAEGTNDLTVFKPHASGEWDLCAPSIIIEEAGGKVTDFDNKPLKYNTGKKSPYNGILLSNNQIHEEILEILNS
ncbi:MAG: inositol monophosphatase family protein [archaeon]